MRKVLFPLLLPWLPTRDFTTKGLILGGAVTLLFAVLAVLTHPEWVWLERAGWLLMGLLSLSPVTAFLALNFTGSTPFTSKSGVRSEIYTYVPTMAVLFGTGFTMAIVLFLVRLWGG